MPSTSSRVGGMKMKKLMHPADLLGLEGTVGSGIQRLIVSAHMIFIMEISEAGEDLSFAQVMRMNQRLCFVMLFVGTSTHIIGLLTLIIFSGGTLDILIQKAQDVGVVKLTMRTKYPLRQRYLWHGKLLD